MRFATLISLSAICALALAACRSPVSSSKDSNGSVVVAVTVPARAESSYPAALREALSEEGRYIHPDTRSVEAVISGTGISEPISARADLAVGETSAVVRFASVPAGSGRTLTVSLYDAGGTLLARGTASLDIEGGERTEVDIAAVPLTATTVAPGPYETGVRGTEIDGDDAGATRIVQFDLPKAGAYVVYFSDYDSPDLPVLYGPDGRRVSTRQASAYTKSFTAAVPGSYYVAVDVPAEYSFEANLTIDADTTVTASGPTLYVDPTLTVMDRQRAFTLTVACGYAPGSAGVIFGMAEGTGKSISATNGSTIAVMPGTGGLSPTASAPTNCQMNFTDALLGIYRTEIYFNLHAAPRTVVYLTSAGTKPADSAAAYDLTLSLTTEAINNMTTETNPVVVAVAAGAAVTEESSVLIGKPTLILGGCDGASWSRGPSHGTSAIALWSSETDSTLTVSSGASGTVFDSLNITRGNTVPTASHATISIEAKSRFSDCNIRFQNTNIVPSFSGMIYTYLRLGAEAELDRCTVVGGVVSINAATYSYSSVRVVEIAADGPVTIVNSLLSPGSVDASGTNPSYSNGLYSEVENTVVNVTGTTISAGAGTSTSHRFNSAYFLYQLTLRMSNCLLISDNPAGQPYNYSLYTPSTSSTNVRNSLISYPNAPGSNNVVQIDGDLYSVDYWTNTIGTANLFALWGDLSLGSTIPSSADYLKPSGSSALTTGGVALTAAVAGFTPSGGEGAFLVDRLGNPRTAPWTIGAYEY